MKVSIRFVAIVGCAGCFLAPASRGGPVLPYVPAALRHGFEGAYFTDMSHGYVFGDELDHRHRRWWLDLATGAACRSAPVFFSTA